MVFKTIHKSCQYKLLNSFSLASTNYMPDIFSIKSKSSLFTKNIIDLEKWLCFVKHRDRNVISPKIDTFFGKSVKNEAKKDYIVTWVAMHIRFTRKFFELVAAFLGKSWIELTENKKDYWNWITNLCLLVT